MDLQQLLNLTAHEDETAIHYFKNGAHKDGQIVASVIKEVSRLSIQAQLGDDENFTNFSFTHDGPVAVIYHNHVTLRMLRDTMHVYLGVMAFMSAVTYADVSMWRGITHPLILPTRVMQYDSGDPKRYDLAKELITHYTGAEWDEEFLVKKYQAYKEATEEHFAKTSGWIA